MAIHATPEDRTVERCTKLGAIAARLVGPIAFVACALFGTTLISDDAEASRVCGERTAILKQLQRKHDETPRALGLSADGGVLEVLVSPEGGWTILVTYPKRPTCIVAIGEAWQTLQLVGRPA